MKIVIKAENRVYPDNIGDYLWESIKSAADQLGIELIRLPMDEFCGNTTLGVAREEVEWINNINPDLFIFFSNWVHGRKSRMIAQEYDKIKCPVLFWSREDPNHYEHFLSDATHADIIGTCCSDCIPKYEAHPTRKKQKVISLPMAVAPEIFYPPNWIEEECDDCDADGFYSSPEVCPFPSAWHPEYLCRNGCEDGIIKHAPKYSDREWDIVFLGNRYTTRQIRNDAEAAVVIAAAKWAIANGKKMGVWGHDGAPYGWWKVPEIYNTGIYQGRCDRLEAADIYRNAKVALSVSSNDYSPTMSPNRVVQIAASGTILIAYKSPASVWQTGGQSCISDSAYETEFLLNDIFYNADQYITWADFARAHVLADHTFKHRLETILEAMK